MAPGISNSARVHVRRLLVMKTRVSLAWEENLEPRGEPESPPEGPRDVEWCSHVSETLFFMKTRRLACTGALCRRRQPQKLQTVRVKSMFLKESVIRIPKTHVFAVLIEKTQNE